MPVKYLPYDFLLSHDSSVAPCRINQNQKNISWSNWWGMSNQHTYFWIDCNRCNNLYVHVKNDWTYLGHIINQESFNVLDCGIYRVISRRGSQSDEETGSLINQSTSEEERLKEFSFVQEEDQVEQGKRSWATKWAINVNDITYKNVIRSRVSGLFLSLRDSLIWIWKKNRLSSNVNTIITDMTRTDLEVQMFSSALA